MKGSTLARWAYFEPDLFITNAGVVILAQTWTGRTMQETRYLVRQVCCGTDVELSHRAIVRRTSGACKVCRQKMTGAKNLRMSNKERMDAVEKRKVVDAIRTGCGWTPPPSALTVPLWWMWADRGGL